jgi:hypothetical protein
MRKATLILTAAAGLIMANFVRANEGDTPNATNDQTKATELLESFLNDVHRSDNVRLVKTSLFFPYASGTHHYLIAKAFVTFYNHETQQKIGVLVETVDNWTFELSEEQLDYFVRTGDRTHLPLPPNLDPLAADKPGYQAYPRPVDPPPVALPPVVQPTPPPSPEPTIVVTNPYADELTFINNISQSFDTHDWSYITRLTVSGNVNYFGHLKASNNFIIRDMQGDARNYAWVKSITYPDSFTHEVSNEYSSRWSGPMIYDSIAENTEAMERNGRLHRASVRMTVGYTLVNGLPNIYALVLKVL